jgi:hypothetical protein
MIKGIEHMYAIDQSKLRESKTFSSLYWRENPNPRIGWGCVLIIMSWAWPITEGQESKCTHTLI